jgi:hypothetical protein
MAHSERKAPPEGAKGCGSGKEPAPLSNSAHANSATPPETWGEPAALPALRDRLNARGYSLFELSDASFIASRWGVVAALPDLQAVARFARSATGGSYAR